MKSTEQFQSQISDIRHRREYRNFFTWSANLPFLPETIREAFALHPYAQIVDLVGCANITNLIVISEAFSRQGGGIIRVFDAAEETNIFLQHYFSKLENTQKTPSESGVSWIISPNARLPISGHDEYKTASTMQVSLINKWYEMAYKSEKKLADIIFIDKTLMWASNPIALLQSFVWRPTQKKEKIIALSIYKSQPIIVHALKHGRRIGGIGKNDKVSIPADTYPGMLATLSDILRDDSHILWQKERSGRLFAYPKRANGKTHWLPDFDPASIDMSQTVYGRQYGEFILDKGVDKCIHEGQREFWHDGSGTLYKAPITPQDRKFIIGGFDIVDVIMNSDSIDIEKAKGIQSKKHYSAEI